ncbi:hypothetical protein TSOC_000245, partial [Tetrabaena socialis]
AASGRVPVAELLSRLAAGRSILGVAIRPLSVEVAVLAPPYRAATTVRSGKFLSPEELRVALTESQADAVVLGGTAAFRTDGSTQLGVRKLISGLRGLVYDSDWLPTPVKAAGGAHPGADLGAPPVPVWLCRRGTDDAAQLVLEYVQAHASTQQRRAVLSSEAPS